MIEIIKDTVNDGIKLVPFLFLAFLFIELIEHKMGNKSKKLISKSGKFGPVIGSVLGCFPQCGFSVMATNLYITRIISLGTLISIYLSTSDEMLPILLSENVEVSVIIRLLGIKVVVGFIFGFIIDLILRKKSDDSSIKNYEICERDHCHCEKGIVKSTISHTLNTLFFIMIISFILNIGLTYVGEAYLAKIFLKNSVFGPFITSLVGLIPNCGASVMITELYLKNAISLGATMSGLLTGSGVAFLVLFKSNQNLKENIRIIGSVYFIGVLVGLIIEFFSLFY